MAAAVAVHRNEPHLGASSRTSSPMDSKKNILKQEDTSQKSSPTQTKSSLSNPSESALQSQAPNPTVHISEPLAPPPTKPSQNNPTDTPDYFSGFHNGGSTFSLEPNPFEQSFGAPSTDTPGKSLLPPVASLTSPAIPGTGAASYNWQNSLRAGPLSPAMLAGPAGSTGDYFDSIGRGFPTPSESALRTGLTPGGGGSMFPAPSPNSQAIFQQLQNGGATPGTLDFHRTAMNAAARSKNSTAFGNTLNAQDQPQQQNMDQNAQHDVTDAANGLFMLQKAQNGGQFTVPNGPAQPPPIQAKPTQTLQQEATKRAGRNTISIGSVSAPDVESPESPEDDSRPNTRGGRGKKTAKAQQAAATNGRRKAEETPKFANKRSKGNNGVANVDPNLEGGDSDDMDEEEDDANMVGADGKKMTDEEKRRNFLERNRVAALKCRQRKKQWLANLQAKVEMYSAENDTLNSQVAQLHEEIRNLRTLLMGHKDCPVGHAQGIGAFLSGMNEGPGFANQHVNPYGMAMNGGMQAGMQRT